MAVEAVGGGGEGMRVGAVEKRGADWRVARVGEGGETVVAVVEDVVLDVVVEVGVVVVVVAVVRLGVVGGVLVVEVGVAWRFGVCLG